MITSRSCKRRKDLDQITRKSAPRYLSKIVRNQCTNTITTNVPVLLAHLFTTCRAIESEELKEKEDILTTKVFDITQPLMILFNEIKELQ